MFKGFEYLDINTLPPKKESGYWSYLIKIHFW